LSNLDIKQNKNTTILPCHFNYKIEYMKLLYALIFEL
jgi:hypothetical protein